MAKALEQIGEVNCPICALRGKKTLVPLKQQGNGLAILTCGYCDTKIQTYSGAVGRGDFILRSVNLDQKTDEPEQKQQHATPEQKPQPAPVQAPQKPTPKRGGTLLG